MNSHQLKLPLGRYLGKEEQTTRVKKAKNEGGQTFKGLCCGSGGKESACNVGDLGSIPELGKSPGERNGYPLQYHSWDSPWTEEPGGLQSMGLQRVEQD